MDDAMPGFALGDSFGLLSFELPAGGVLWFWFCDAGGWVTCEAACGGCGTECWLE